MLQPIITNNYIYIFTSPEISLSKKFNINLFYNSCFSTQFLLLAIDEIYLVKEWSKKFCFYILKMIKFEKKYL